MGLNVLRSSRRRYLTKLRTALALAATGCFWVVGLLVGSQPVTAAAGINPTVNFQGRLLTNAGAVVADGNYNMRFKIYQDGTGRLANDAFDSPTAAGTLLWTETRQNSASQGVVVRNGYYSVNLGSVNAFGSSVDWNQDTLWLSMDVTTNGTDTGGSPTYNGELLPMKRLASAVYALNAGQLGGLASSAYAQLAATQTFTGTNTYQPTTNIPSVVIKQTSVGSPTADVFDLQTANGTTILQATGPAANESAVTLQSVGATRALTLTSQAAATWSTVAGLLTVQGGGGVTVKSADAATATGNVIVSSGVQTGSSLTSGSVTISTGNAAGGTNTSSGSITIDTGTKNGSGTTGSVTIGGTNASAISIGNTSAITTLNGPVVVAASQYLKITGSGTRPGTPSAGMLYYDTTQNQMLQWNGSKWVADRSTTTKIVAASNSTQAMKDAADYVATGTNDQTTINTALTAAAGGTVYLAEGTYVAGATITIPNNTTLEGAGIGTTVELADLDATENLIENSDTSTGTGVVIRDLKLDGRSDLNTAGTQVGIYLNHMGSGNTTTAKPGAKISNLWVTRFRSEGIYTVSSPNTEIESNTVQATQYGIDVETSNGTIVGHNRVMAVSSTGINLNSSDYVTVTGNTFDAGGAGAGDGILAYNSNKATITGNTSTGAVAGITLGGGSGSSNAVISGNVADGTTYAIRVGTGSNASVVGNTAHDSPTGIYIASYTGAVISGNRVSSSTYGINVSASATSTSVTSNTISNSTCTTSCTAINIDGTNTYLASNYLISDGGSPMKIVDTGTGTVYASQQNASQVLQSGSSLLQANTSSSLTGTGAISAGTTITGTSTYFTLQLQVGDRVTINSETRTISAIGSNTSATVDTAFTTTASGQTITRLPAALVVANSSSSVKLTVDNTGALNVWSGTVKVGTPSQAGSVLISDGSSNTATLQFAASAADVTYQFPAASAGTYDICTTAAVCSGYAPSSGSASYIQNQSAGQQATSNFWISGTGRADASFLSPLVDALSGGTLGLGTGNATGIAIGKTGSNITTTISGLTVVKPTSGNDSTTAFQVQNGAGAALITADTTNMQTTTQSLNVGQAADRNTGGRYFADGFETGSAGPWTSSGVGGGTLTYDTTTVHSGKYSTKYVTSSNFAEHQVTVLGSTTMYGREYFNATATPGNPTTLMDFGTNVLALGNHLYIYLGASGNLCYNWAAGTSTACSSTAPTNGAWHEIETEVIAGGAGTSTLKVWLDGTLVTSNSNAINFTNGSFGSSNWVNFAVGGNISSSSTVYFDDVAVDTQATGLAAGLNVNDGVHIGGNTTIAAGLLIQPASNTSSALTIKSGSTTAISVQNLINQQIFGFDTVNKVFALGSSGNATATEVFYNGTGSGTSITLTPDTTANGVLTLPGVTGILCANTNNCGYQASGNYLVQAPTSTATNTIAPTGASTTGLTVKQTSTASPSGDIIDIFGANGTTSFLQVTSTAANAGAVTLQSQGAGNALTLTGAGAFALSGGAASTISSGANTLAVTSSMFNISTLGALTLGGASQAGTLLLQDGAGHTVTLQAGGTQANSPVLSLPASVAATDTICLQTKANCGGGSGDNITVNSTAATDANFLNVTASGTVAGTTWSINTASNPDDITLAVSTASATTAGIVNTSNGQTFAGDKTFTGSLTVGSTTDQVQLIVRANATQSAGNPLIMLTASNGTTELARINSDTFGNFFAGWRSGISLVPSGVGPTGTDNTGVGNSSLLAITTGNNNAALGGEALAGLLTGSNNTAVGYAAAANITGDNNVAVGKGALGGVVNADGNVAIGNSAGAVAGAGASFYWNNFLGQSAGYGDTDTFSTLAGIHNATAIGANAQVQASDSLVLGSIGSDGNVKVGIGTTIPLNTFSVSPLESGLSGTASQSGSTTITGSGSNGWTSAMIGDQFIWADGNSGIIATVPTSSSLTLVSGSYTETTQKYRIHHVGFQVTSAGAAYVQQTSSAAFAVKNAAGTSLLVADTSAGAVTLAGDLSFSGAGNTSRTIRKSMVVTTAVNANDVVIIDASNAGQVTTTTTANSPRVFGIATTTNAGTGVTQDIAIGGVFQVNAPGAVNIGDFLVTTTTAGAVASATNPAAGTVLGRALSAKGAGAGTVWVTLSPGAGGTADSLQAAYDNSASPASIVLTTAKDGLLLQNPASSGTDSGYTMFIEQLNTGAVDGLRIASAGTGALLKVTDSTATSVDVLTIADTGATTFKNQTNGTTAFQVQNVAGNPYLLIDTSGAIANFGNTTIAGTVNLGNTTGAVAQTINIGTNANASGTNTVNIGNGTATASTVSIQGGTAANTAITLGTNGAGGITVDSGTTGNILIGAGTGNNAKTITIGPTATKTSATTVQIGVNTAGTETIHLGSVGSGDAAAGTTVNIQGGTNAATAINLGTNGAGGITIDSGTTGSVLIGAGTGNNAKTITIGPTATKTSATTLKLGVNIAGQEIIQIGSAGTGDANASTTVSIQGGTTADTAVIIGTNGAGGITVDSGTTGNVNIGTGTGNNAKTINIGPTATKTSATTIKLGVNIAGQEIIQIGSAGTGDANASTTVSIQGGTTASTAITLGTNGAGGITMDTGTTGSILIGAGTSNNAKTITLGPTATKTSATTLQLGINTAGTETIQLGSAGTGDAAAGTTINIQGGTTANTAVVIGTNGAGGITLDSGTTGNVNIGTGASAKAIQIGTTSTNTGNTQTIGIGNLNAAGTTNVTIGTGSSATGGTTTIQSKGTLAVTSAAALNLTGAAASTLNVGATNTLAVTSSNFNVTTGGDVSAIGSYILSGAGNVSRTIRKNMIVTTAVTVNDVVAIDTVTAGQVTTTTTANSTKVFGIATTTNAGTGVAQDIVIGGIFQVTATTAGAVAIGDFLATTTTAGQVASVTNPAAGTVLGRALSAKAGATPGTVWVYLSPGSGGTADSLQAAYDNGNTISMTTGRDVTITSPEVATDPSFVFNSQCTTCSASGGRFAVQNAGTDVFTVIPNLTGITVGSSAYTGQITLGQADTTNTISIGSANLTAHTQTISIGNGTSTTSGGEVVNIANGAPGTGTTNAINIGTGGSTTGTVGVIIGSNANAAHTTEIRGGSGSSAIFLNPQTTGQIVIGGTAGTGQITVGSSTAAQTVVVAGGTGAATVQIANGVATATGNTVTIAGGATGATLTDTINIGTGNSASGTAVKAKDVHIADGTPAGTNYNAVTIGSLANASVTTIQGGSGSGIKLLNNQASAGVLVQNTNASDSTTAFQVQNHSNNAVFDVDTSGNQVLFGKASTLTGTLLLYNATNGNTVSVASSTTSASYTIALPTAIGTTGQCLAVSSVASTTETLGYASCGGPGDALAGTWSSQTLPAATNTQMTINFNGAANSAPSFSSPNLTLPSNASRIVVETKAGGGGGGATGATSANKAAGGGGEGGSSKSTISGTLASNYYYKIGAKGNGGNAGNNNGAAGSDSCFGTNNSDACTTPTTQAKGGSGGSLSNGSAMVAGGAGGIVGTGDVKLGGTPGGWSNGTVTTGLSSGAGGGTGGGLGLIAAAAGNAATVGGGGGGGALSQTTVSNAGGNGGDGYMVITVYTSGAPIAVGAIDSQAASSNGAVIASGSIYFQSASITNPGMVNTASQSFTGDKLFSTSIVNPFGGIGSYGNLLVRSEDFGTTWTASSITVTANSTAAPDGNTTADTLANASAAANYVEQTYTTSTAGTYTFSVWLKNLSGSTAAGLCIYVAGGGTPSACSATAVTTSGTWQRFSVTQAVTATVTSVKVRILPGNGAVASDYAWGAQMVLSSNPGVYTRTTSSTVAANGGVVSTGTALFQNAVDSTSSFQVQNSSGTTVLGVDTTNTQVLFGVSGSSAGKLVVFGSSGKVTITAGATTDYTLTLPTAAPASNGLCLQATTAGVASWAACGGAGSSRATLVPEYPGASLTPDGSANVGTMTSDFCSKTNGVVTDTNTAVCVTAADKHNYYSWTSASGDNDYDIYVRYQLVSALAKATSTINIYGWRTDATNNDVAVSVYNGSGALCGATTSVATGTATWTETAIGSMTADTDCDMTQNTMIIFKIHMVASAGEFARVGEIRIDY
jgi:fibronectin-binding autotransporter adhesin